MKRYYVIENKDEVGGQAFRMMGMSTKSGSDAIGKFGTGNKYAACAILAAGLKLVVTSGEKLIQFKTRKVDFRGQEFNQVFIREGHKYYDTSMTTEMGKEHWNTDAALREFISNAIDEGGFRWFQADEIEGVAGVTRVYVQASSLIKAYFDKFSDNFLVGEEPLWKTEEGDFAIYKKRDTEGAFFYRRGVKVFHTEKKCLYAYEFKDIELRENRTASQWDVMWELGRFLNKIPVGFRKSIILAMTNDVYVESLIYSNPICVLESDLSWAELFEDRVVVSTEECSCYRENLLGFSQFLVTAGFAEKMNNAKNVRRVKDILKSAVLNGWEVNEIDEYEQGLINNAVGFLVKIGYEVEVQDVVVANNNKENAPMGQYVEGKLYLNKSVFKMGADEVLDTITHEYFHHKSKENDKTRGFESFLIKECLYFAKRYLALKEKSV